MQARLWMIFLGLLVGIATFGPRPGSRRANGRVWRQPAGGRLQELRDGADHSGLCALPVGLHERPLVQGLDIRCRGGSRSEAALLAKEYRSGQPPRTNAACQAYQAWWPVSNSAPTAPGAITAISRSATRTSEIKRSCFARRHANSEDQCKSWTYVKPGIQGPNARCWLKSATPGAKANNCCISGVRPVKPIKTGSGGGTGGLDLDPNGKSIQQCREALALNRAVLDRTGNPVVISSCYQQIQAAQGGSSSAWPPPRPAEQRVAALPEPLFLPMGGDAEGAQRKTRAHRSPALSWDACLAGGPEGWAAACTRQHSGFQKATARTSIGE